MHAGIACWLVHKQLTLETRCHFYYVICTGHCQVNLAVEVGLWQEERGRDDEINASEVSRSYLSTCCTQGESDRAVGLTSSIVRELRTHPEHSEEGRPFSRHTLPSYFPVPWTLPTPLSVREARRTPPPARFTCSVECWKQSIWNDWRGKLGTMLPLPSAERGQTTDTKGSGKCITGKRSERFWGTWCCTQWVEDFMDFAWWRPAYHSHFEES